MVVNGLALDVSEVPIGVRLYLRIRECLQWTLERLDYILLDQSTLQHIHQKPSETPLFHGLVEAMSQDLKWPRPILEETPQEIIARYR